MITAEIYENDSINLYHDENYIGNLNCTIYGIQNWGNEWRIALTHDGDRASSIFVDLIQKGD